MVVVIRILVLLRLLTMGGRRGSSHKDHMARSIAAPVILLSHPILYFCVDFSRGSFHHRMTLVMVAHSTLLFWGSGSMNQRFSIVAAVLRAWKRLPVLSSTLQGLMLMMAPAWRRLGGAAVTVKIGWLAKIVSRMKVLLTEPPFARGHPLSDCGH